MAILEVVFAALQAAHGELTGSFRAMNYALTFPNGFDPWDVGLIQEVEKLRDEPDDAALTQLLIFLHETNHLAFFVGSAFGLAALLSLEETVLSFLRSAPSPSIDKEAQFQSLVLYSSEKRRFEFYYADELGNAGGWQADRRDDETNPAGALFLYSPLPRLGAIAPEEDGPRARIPGRVIPNRYAEEIRFTRRTSTGDLTMKINAASLFEALAILTECTTIAESMEGVSFAEILHRMLPDLDDVYGSVFRIYLGFTALPDDELQIILPAVIDIALMQELYHEDGSAPGEAVARSRSIRTPAAYLLEGLRAAERLGSFRTFWLSQPDEPDIYRAAELYQDAVSESMKLPTTRAIAAAILGALQAQAAEGTFEDRAATIGELEISPAIFNDAGTIDFRIPLVMHIRALQLRLSVDGFFAQSLSVLGLHRIFDLCFRDTIIVDPATSRIINESRLPLSVLAPQALLNLLDEAPHAHCPYQEGQPFFCGSGKDALCWSGSFDPAKTLQLCPFYLLGTILDEPKGDLEIVAALRKLGLPRDGCRVVRSRR